MNLFSKKMKFSFIFFLILALLFQAIPFYNLIVKGVYRWHIQQPNVTEGGLQLLVIFVFFGLVEKFFKSNIVKLFLIIIVTILYLRFNYVLEPTIFAWIYFEIIMQIGKFFRTFLRLMGKSENQSLMQFYFPNMLIGLLVWATLAIILSLLGLGTIFDLRILTIILGALSFVFSHDRKLTIILLIEKFKFIESKSRIIVYFLLVAVLALLAKSNTAIDYDSLWYGLRSDYVLVGDHSFYDNLGFVSMVYFYPKLFELISLPLSGTGEYSFIYSFNTILYLNLLILIFSFVNKKIHNLNYSLLITLVIGTIPTIYNTGAQAKPDMIMTYLITLSIVYFVQWVDNFNKNYFIYGVISFMLAFCVKPTAYIYLGLLFIGVTLVALLIVLKQKKKLSVFFSWSQIIYILMAIFIVLGIYYRTYILTGVPIYISALKGLWNKFGFDFQYPFSLLLKPNESTTESSNEYVSNGTNFMMENLEFLWERYFNPSELPQILMMWIGNVQLFLLLFSLYLIVFKPFKLNALEMIWPNKIKYVLLLMPLCLGSVVLIFYTKNMDVRGGDGNYFNVAIILGIILMFLFVYNLMNKIQQRKKIIIFLLIFIPFQSTYSFISHSSWAYGTSTINFDLTKTYKETREINKEKLTNIGLGKIYSYLESEKSSDRMLFNGSRDMEQTVNKLPARIESITNIDVNIGVPELVANSKNFIDYIKWANIKYIINNKNAEGSAVVDEFSQKALNVGGVKIVDDTDYYLLDISNVDLDSVSTAEIQTTQQVLLSFLDVYDKAEFKNRYSINAPWKQSVALVDLEDSKRAIFLSPDSSITFDIKLEELEEQIQFITVAGFHPDSLGWGVSDGFNAKVVVLYDDGSQEALFNENINYKDNNIIVNKLFRPQQKEFKIVFSSFNATDSNNLGDWGVFSEPKLLNVKSNLN